jgi:hypothetical protein|tara:strand:- start:291 stop:716 length:426 start_codon:yes stop_codon:yes gene_type:complete
MVCAVSGVLLESPKLVCVTTFSADLRARLVRSGLWKEHAKHQVRALEPEPQDLCSTDNRGGGQKKGKGKRREQSEEMTAYVLLKKVPVSVALKTYLPTRFATYVQWQEVQEGSQPEGEGSSAKQVRRVAVADNCSYTCRCP